MPTPSGLHALLTVEMVRELAGAASFQRGQRYAAQGRVRALVLRGDTLTHPADVLPILVREVGTLVAQADKRVYDSAIDLLKRIRGIHRHLEQPETWTALLARLRQQYKVKRTFIALASTL